MFVCVWEGESEREFRALPPQYNQGRVCTQSRRGKGRGWRDINEVRGFSFPGPLDQHQDQHSQAPIEEELFKGTEFSN